MHSVMTPTKDERVHIRIEDDLKQDALAVVRLRGLGSLSVLVTTLLKEEINHERQNRPELFADELKRVRAASGVKRSVPVVSPANVADGNDDKRKPKEQKTLAKKRNRKR